MQLGSFLTNIFSHFIWKLGPFVDINHDLISTGNIQYSFEELFQRILNHLAEQLAGFHI